MLQIYIIHLIYLTFNPDKYKFCFLTSSPIFPSVTETVTPKGSQGLICRVHLQSTSSWSYWGFSRPAAMVTDIKLLLCSWQSDTSLASRLWLFAMSLPLPKAWLLPWACPCPFRRHACFLEHVPAPSEGMTASLSGCHYALPLGNCPPLIFKLDWLLRGDLAVKLG